MTNAAARRIGGQGMSRDDLLEWIVAHEAVAGCWDDWPGALNGSGYAIAGGRLAGRAVLDSIHPWHPPLGNCALHSCDTRRCLSPAHLSWGTHAENMRQAAERGRMARNGGVPPSQAKLSEEQVAAIKASLDSVSVAGLARMHGVAPHTIRDIRNGTAWADGREGVAGELGLPMKGRHEHALSIERSGERGTEASNTGTCRCGWQESASSQREVRFEYREHFRATRARGTS